MQVVTAAELRVVMTFLAADVPHHSPSLPLALSALLPWCFLMFGERVDIGVYFIAEHSTINYSNPAISYESAVTTTHYSKKLI